MTGLEFFCKAVFIGISIFLLYAITPLNIKQKCYRYAADRAVGVGVILSFLSMGYCFYKWMAWNS